MERDSIDVFISSLLIGGFFFLLKVVGGLYDRYTKRSMVKKKIGEREYDVYLDTSEELCIGGGKLIQSQMESIIREVGSSYKKITFVEGNANFLGEKYATYSDGFIKYKTGKVVEIKLWSFSVW